MRLNRVNKKERRVNYLPLFFWTPKLSHWNKSKIMEVSVIDIPVFTMFIGIYVVVFVVNSILQQVFKKHISIDLVLYALVSIICIYYYKHQLTMKTQLEISSCLALMLIIPQLLFSYLGYLSLKNKNSILPMVKVFCDQAKKTKWRIIFRRVKVLIIVAFIVCITRNFYLLIFIIPEFFILQYIYRLTQHYLDNEEFYKV